MPGLARRLARSRSAGRMPGSGGGRHGRPRRDRLRRGRPRRLRGLDRVRRPFPPRGAGRSLGQARGGLRRLCGPRRGPGAPAGRHRRAAHAGCRRAGNPAIGDRPAGARRSAGDRGMASGAGRRGAAPSPSCGGGPRAGCPGRPRAACRGRCPIPRSGARPEGGAAATCGRCRRPQPAGRGRCAARRGRCSRRLPRCPVPPLPCRQRSAPRVARDQAPAGACAGGARRPRALPRALHKRHH